MALAAAEVAAVVGDAGAKVERVLVELGDEEALLGGGRPNDPLDDPALEVDEDD